MQARLDKARSLGSSPLCSGRNCGRIELEPIMETLCSMADHSSSPSASFEVLLHEIEATPREYWSDLLDTLRQFRQNIPSTAPRVIDAEQARKNQAAIDLLDSWLSDEEDASEHQQTWDFLNLLVDMKSDGAKSTPLICDRTRV